MTGLRFARGASPLIGLGGLAALLGYAAAGMSSQVPAAAGAVAGIAVLLALAYFIWTADPAWTLTAGLLLAVFSGYWDEMGVPTVIAPDRVVLAGGLLVLAIRARRQPAPRRTLDPIHWLLLATVLFAACSALASDSLFNIPDSAALVERFGVIPFLLFYFAPVAFATERQRRVLMTALVALGAYLGLTALFEAAGADALVFPRYILDPAIGILPERARGPFVDPPALGVALLLCGGACLMAFRLWQSIVARAFAAGVALLCVAGLLFTLTRQVWIGSLLGVLVAGAVYAPLRRRVVPLLVATAVIGAGAVAVVPGLQDKVQQRSEDKAPIWDRLNVNRAALAALEDHPVAGLGWQRWLPDGLPYLTQAPDYPLTRASSRITPHNAFLLYLAQLGLLGGGLWIASLFLGAGRAVLRRPPPELAAWRALGLTVFVCGLTSFLFQPGQGFVNVIIWLLAGVLASAWTPSPPLVRRPVS